MLAAGERRHEPRALLVGAEREDRQRGGARVHGDRHAHARVRPRELLEHEDVREEVGAGAAVLLGDADAHQPELGELRVAARAGTGARGPTRPRAARSPPRRTRVRAPGSPAARAPARSPWRGEYRRAEPRGRRTPRSERSSRSSRCGDRSTRQACGARRSRERCAATSGPARSDRSRRNDEVERLAPRPLHLTA